jgi:predicted RNA methylase
VDQFYTPAGLAASLLGDLNDLDVTSMADFAIGGGALAAAATARWADVSVFGMDIDDQAVRELRRAHPEWTLTLGDFLSTNSVAEPLAGLRRKFDLILLNPPFSARGNRRVDVDYRGFPVRASPPAAFVAKSLGFLSEFGILRAIVPRNTTRSEKDAELWGLVSHDHVVREIAVVRRGAFVDATAEAVILEVSARGGTAGGSSFLGRANGLRVVQGESVTVNLTRGNVPVHTLVGKKRGDLPIIHTTSLGLLAAGRMHKVGRVDGSVGIRTVQGPVLLLPRVGLPKAGNFRPVVLERRTGLTDCVFAISAGSRELAHVEDRMLAEWDAFLELYDGSCARYITRRRLVQFLAGLGVIEGSAG